MNEVLLNSHHKIWRIAAPMMLANISVPLLGLVDAAILGHLESPRYLAAVAVGTSILSILYWGFGFLRMGTTGASAQAWGASDATAQSRVFIQSATLALLLSALIMLLAPPLIPFAVAWLNAPPEAAPLSVGYLNIRLYSAPAVLLTYVAIGWLLGQQRARWALTITVLTNLLNIILDYWFILGLGLNTQGAALASVISEYGGALVALLAIAPSLRRHCARTLLTLAARLSDYPQLLQSSGALFVRTTALLLALAFFTAHSAEFGTTVLAANTLLINLMFFTAHALDGFAHAAEALTGEAVGKRDFPDFLRTCRRCAEWSVATAALLSLVLWLGKPLILAVLTDISEVSAIAASYYPWLIALPLLSAASYLFDGIFIGALQTRWMQHTMLVSIVGVYLPTWYLTQSWGNHGLWFAFCALNLARGLTLAAAFLMLCHHRRWWL
ncbi:MATE family efflux transporter [Litorivivens sp.]|uniref:MATE family efflux transporter n=2 Tax=Litorivivens sp. TaxID=2020868 RepID=UPI0035669462